MKVFLTGATGYVGSAVARALRGAGHEVVGLARTEGAACRLRGAGLGAVLGDMTDAPLMAHCAADSDAVVHAALARGPEIPAADTAATHALLDAVRGTAKRLIYTSGVWVYGETGDAAADERSPTRPVPLAAWRPAIERLVLAAGAPALGADPMTAVIRPALVYGDAGGVFGWLLATARTQGRLLVAGDGENRWPLVHADDLADLYVRVLERAPRDRVFNAVGHPGLRVREVVGLLQQAAGVPVAVEYLPVEQARAVLGPRADAFALDQQVSARLAADVLQWTPRGPSLAEELGVGIGAPALAV